MTASASLLCLAGPCQQTDAARTLAAAAAAAAAAPAAKKAKKAAAPAAKGAETTWFPPAWSDVDIATLEAVAKEIIHGMVFAIVVPTSDP